MITWDVREVLKLTLNARRMKFTDEDLDDMVKHAALHLNTTDEQALNSLEHQIMKFEKHNG